MTSKYKRVETKDIKVQYINSSYNREEMDEMYDIFDRIINHEEYVGKDFFSHYELISVDIYIKDGIITKILFRKKEKENED